ncbi:hypothetical protein V492_04065 [Pseudogymnoascus sp. VKM F-4246]|nr:hypothetical protein V492_04065 [Pseudogymnoascus sp. VKM F-4246]
MAPRRRLLYCGKPESAEKRRADAEKLDNFHVTNLINWSRPPTVSQGTQTDLGWEKHVRHIKAKPEKAKEQRPTYTKGIGTPIIRLPMHTKGLGKVVEPVKPKSDTKGKGKAVEPSEPSGAKGKGKAVDPSELLDSAVEGKIDESLQLQVATVEENADEPPKPPDVRGKEKANEITQSTDATAEGKTDNVSKPPDAKDKGKVVEPPCQLDTKTKENAVQTTAPQNIEYRDKAVQTAGGGYKDRAVQTSDSEYKDGAVLPSESKNINKSADPPEVLGTKGKVVEPPGPANRNAKDKAAEKPGPPDRKAKNKGSEQSGTPDSNREDKPTEPSRAPDIKGKGKATLIPGPQDAKGKSKSDVGQEPQQAPANQTSAQKSNAAPRKRTRLEEEAFPRTFPRMRRDKLFRAWRVNLSHVKWARVAHDNYAFIFSENVYVHPFWVLTGFETCEPLERYRCLWNAGNRLLTKFFEKISEEEKTMQIGIASMMHFVDLFDRFAETGTMDRMIRAAMRLLTQTLDPKQKSKFPLANLWDVGFHVEENIRHWFQVNLIFQGRRIWYKRYFGMISADGHVLPLSTSASSPGPRRALPN